MNQQPESADPAGTPVVFSHDEVILAEAVDEPVQAPGPTGPPTRDAALPAALFLTTWLTTFMAGVIMGPHLVGLLEVLAAGALPSLRLLGGVLGDGAGYAVPVMLILTAHEAGHFLQARRYGVRASLPYFIPVPLPPVGTFGAVIRMDARVPDRKALFDIGISGPLAGLAPTLACLVWGLSMSDYGEPGEESIVFGDPLLLKWLARLILEPAPPGHEVLLNPVLFAGWVGLLITSLNLLPVGQLDGGHVLYALLRNRARPVATAVLGAAALAVVYTAVRYHNPGWLLMLMLLFLMGPAHPPTHDDHVPLGLWRAALGWLTLAFVFVGLTPTPVVR